MRSGDKVGEGTFGHLVDIAGKGLKKDGEPFISNGNGSCPPFACPDNLALSLIARAEPPLAVDSGDFASSSCAELQCSTCPL
jgi:hypothetical protein